MDPEPTQGQLIAFHRPIEGKCDALLFLASANFLSFKCSSRLRPSPASPASPASRSRFLIRYRERERERERQGEGEGEEEEGGKKILLKIVTEASWKVGVYFEHLQCCHRVTWNHFNEPQSNRIIHKLRPYGSSSSSSSSSLFLSFTVIGWWQVARLSFPRNPPRSISWKREKHPPMHFQEKRADHEVTDFSETTTTRHRCLFLFIDAWHCSPPSIDIFFLGFFLFVVACILFCLGLYDSIF